MGGIEEWEERKKKAIQLVVAICMEFDITIKDIEKDLR